jgi:energy-coupling factor transporter ATP-binding protein EcfA2
MPPADGSAEESRPPSSDSFNLAGAAGVQIGDHGVQLNVFPGLATSGSPRAARGRLGPWRVFLSHSSELSQHPTNGSFVATAKRAVERAGHVPVDMDTWAASALPPLASDTEQVASCQVYVAIVGFRYGTRVREDPSRSYTEHEFDTATALGLPRLAFLLDDDLQVPVPRAVTHEPNHDAADRQDGFRARIGSSGVTSRLVSSPKELETALYQALIELADQLARQPAQEPDSILLLPPRSSRVSFDGLRGRYLQRVLRHYECPDLAALTPWGQEGTGYIRLQEVFVPQQGRLVRAPLDREDKARLTLIEAQQRDESLELEGGHLPVVSNRPSLGHKGGTAGTLRPILDVLVEEQCVVILGDPGSGKSALAQHLVLSLMDPTGNGGWCRKYAKWLPIIVELRAYAEPKGRWSTFLEYLGYRYVKDGLGLPANELHHYLEDSGRAWVVFDGLDEVFDDATRESIDREIANFISEYPSVRVLVTSRRSAYRDNSEYKEFAVYALQELDRFQITEFVRRWHRHVHSDKRQASGHAERLLHSIDAGPAVRDWAGNPLLLTILTLIGGSQELRVTEVDRGWCLSALPGW